ncbi:hypothetical protein HK101_002295 [Irineochytrium annulatum]|nr:hypothetical protein HK101_002295 [Irineochytrium annulatum]
MTRRQTPSPWSSPNDAAAGTKPKPSSRRASGAPAPPTSAKKNARVKEEPLIRTIRKARGGGIGAGAPGSAVSKAGSSASKFRTPRESFRTPMAGSPRVSRESVGGRGRAQRDDRDEEDEDEEGEEEEEWADAVEFEADGDEEVGGDGEKEHDDDDDDEDDEEPIAVPGSAKRKKGETPRSAKGTKKETPPSAKGKNAATPASTKSKKTTPTPASVKSASAKRKVFGSDDEGDADQDIDGLVDEVPPPHLMDSDDGPSDDNDDDDEDDDDEAPEAVSLAQTRRAVVEQMEAERDRRKREREDAKRKEVERNLRGKEENMKKRERKRKAEEEEEVEAREEMEEVMEPRGKKARTGRAAVGMDEVALMEDGKENKAAKKAGAGKGGKEPAKDPVPAAFNQKKIGISLELLEAADKLDEEKRKKQALLKAAEEKANRRKAAKAATHTRLDGKDVSSSKTRMGSAKIVNGFTVVSLDDKTFGAAKNPVPESVRSFRDNHFFGSRVRREPAIHSMSKPKDGPAPIFKRRSGSEGPSFVTTGGSKLPKSTAKSGTANKKGKK